MILVGMNIIILSHRLLHGNYRIIMISLTVFTPIINTFVSIWFGLVILFCQTVKQVGSCIDAES